MTPVHWHTSAKASQPVTLLALLNSGQLTIAAFWASSAAVLTKQRVFSGCQLREVQHKARAQRSPAMLSSFDAVTFLSGVQFGNCPPMQSVPSCRAGLHTCRCMQAASTLQVYENWLSQLQLRRPRPGTCPIALLPTSPCLTDSCRLVGTVPHSWGLSSTFLQGAQPGELISGGASQNSKRMRRLTLIAV